MDSCIMVDSDVVSVADTSTRMGSIKVNSRLPFVTMRVSESVRGGVGVSGSDRGRTMDWKV